MKKDSATTEPATKEPEAFRAESGMPADNELLVLVAARLRRLNSIVLAELEIPLTFRQYRTLSRVARGITSPSQLATVANLTLPTVSETVDGLVRRQLMITTPSVVDRRARILQLTELGATAAAAGDLALNDVAEAMTESLNPEMRAAFNASLRAVYESATRYFARNVNAGD